MNRSARELYEKATLLDPTDRAELAALLLENLDEAEAARAEIEEAWAAEVEKRMADYRAGSAKTVSWEDLRAHLHRSDR